MEQSERIGFLIYRYTRRELSVRQKKELSAWRSSSERNEAFFRASTDTDYIREQISKRFDTKDEVRRKLHAQFPDLYYAAPRKQHVRFYYMSRWAAMWIIVIYAFLYSYIHQPPRLEPGGYRASIASHDGFSKIKSDFSRGYAVGHAGIHVVRGKYGSLMYIVPNEKKEAKDKSYTLFTDRGGQFSAKFPDGTLVWVNAETHISYPANFDNDTIRVTLQGEAYFELSDSAHPYIINIPAFANASAGKPSSVIRHPSTLPAGRQASTVIHIPSSVNPPSLRSGGQSRQPSSNTDIKAYPEDSVQVTEDSTRFAWTRGRMYYRNASIRTIMNDLARWYDADIIYKGIIPDRVYNLDLSRDARFIEVISAFRNQGAQLRVKGTTVTISFDSLTQK